MKISLLRKVERFRCLAILLMMVCAFANAEAQIGATSDEINAAIVQEGSVPLTWTNDAEHPWVISSWGDSGCVTCPYGSVGTSLKFTYSSESDTHIKFGYQLSDNKDGDFLIIIDGEELSISGSNNINRILASGNHTVEFIYKSKANSGNAWVFNLSVKELKRYEVKVNNPGEFVANLVDLIGDISVMDVGSLKVTGSLNDNDLEGIKQLKGLVELDLTGTDITAIPAREFYEFENLYTVLLPETLKEIGSYAFAYSSLYKIVVPDSVVEIGGEAFYRCHQLSSVKLSESISEIPWECFEENYSLESIEIPESVNRIGYSAFRYSSLTSVVIPKNVTYLDEYVFSTCRQLKEVTLNSHVNNLYGTFRDCGSLQTVILPSVTPPTAGSEDPFSGVDKDAVTVLVPEFALSAYKADSYWFQFRNIKSSADISTSDFWAIHGHLKLNSSQTLPGSPSIEIEAGGILDVAANTPLALGEVTYSNQEDVPAVFLNESDRVTATGFTAKFNVPNSGRWYFFSPVTDVKMADVTYPASDSWVIRYYDGNRRAAENSASGNWVNVPADGTLRRGQGYIIQAATAGTLIMPAAASEHSAFFGIADAAMTLADNSGESAENSGWNLMGNPYPAFYDIYSMALQAPITVWDGSTYRAYSLSDDDFVLRPMQPFFVQKSAADLTLGMPRSGRQGTGVVTRSAAPRANVVDANRHRLNLEITGGENETADDYTRIVLNEAASLRYEGSCDASKFMSIDKKTAQIYSLGDNRHPLSINERPYADGNAALGVYLPSAGETYRISASRADRRVWLYDAASGEEQDLTEGDYIFTADRTGAIDSRFSLRFAPSASTAAEGVEGASVKVAGGKGMLTVSAPAGAVVAVFAADGSLIANVREADGAIEVAVAPGVYVVKVNGQGYKTIVK